MNRLLIIVGLFAIVSCGSKKKLTSINKEDVSVKVEVLKDVEKKESVVKTDTSKESKSKKEVATESTVREIIFNDKGIIERIIERSDKTSSIDTYEEFLIALNEVKEAIEIDKSTSKSDSSMSAESKDTELVKTGKNPIWNWIGGALFICILLYFGWKVILKK